MKTNQEKADDVFYAMAGGWRHIDYSEIGSQEPRYAGLPWNGNVLLWSGTDFFIGSWQPGVGGWGWRNKGGMGAIKAPTHWMPLPDKPSR